MEQLFLSPVKAIFILLSSVVPLLETVARVVSPIDQTKLLNSGCFSALLSHNKSELFQLLLIMLKKNICKYNLSTKLPVVYDYLPATLIDFCSAK